MDSTLLYHADKDETYNYWKLNEEETHNNWCYCSIEKVKHNLNKIYDENREKEINEILNCKFIRYKPYDNDFNIFNLLNRIYLHIK